jgi:hypothetical protein
MLDNWPKDTKGKDLTPNKLRGQVDSSGKLSLSKGKIGLSSAQFDGPANGAAGQENRLTGTLVIAVSKQVSCGYSVNLIHAPDGAK